jgi:hypothetical protein
MRMFDEHGKADAAQRGIDVAPRLIGAPERSADIAVHSE